MAALPGTTFSKWRSGGIPLLLDFFPHIRHSHAVFAFFFGSSAQPTSQEDRRDDGTPAFLPALRRQGILLPGQEALPLPVLQFGIFAGRDAPPVSGPIAQRHEAAPPDRPLLPAPAPCRSILPAGSRAGPAADAPTSPAEEDGDARRGHL